mgnify:CR=1 FL=1
MDALTKSAVVGLVAVTGRVAHAAQHGAVAMSWETRQHGTGMLAHCVQGVDLAKPQA